MLCLHNIIDLRQGILNILLMCPLIVTAQQDDLPVEEVEVIKNFEARLAEADKLNVNPTFPPLDTTMEAYDYELSTYEASLEYIKPDIRPLAMTRDKQLTAYDGFLKGGYGFPNQTYFRGEYHAEGKRGQIYDFRARHQAAHDKSYDFKRYMENDLDASVKFPLQDNMALNAQAGYSLDRYYYYGYDHSDTTIDYTDEEAEKQFNELRAGIGIENYEPLRGNINYSAQLNFYHRKDDLATRENGFKLDLLGEKFIDDKHPLRIRLTTDYTNLKDTLQRKLNNFHLQPDFTWQGENYQLKGGLRVSSSDDDFYFFPIAEAKVKLSGQRVIGFIGMKGNLHKNSYRHLTDYNPYITERIDTLANSKLFDFYGGVSGRYRGLTYEVTGSYKIVEHLALYLPMEGDLRRFKTVFDDVNMTRIKARVTYDMEESLRIALQASKNFYNPEREDRAWHLPGFEVNLSSTYITENRNLWLKGEIFMKSGWYSLNKEHSEEKLDGLFDFSLAADYYLSDAFGLFLQFNNITNNKGERWKRYPTFGINAVGGLQYRF